MRMFTRAYMHVHVLLSTQFGKGLQTYMYTTQTDVDEVWRSAYMHVFIRILIRGWDSLSFWFAQFGKGRQHM